MTSDAFTTTVTLSLALMPNSSTDSLVIEEVTIWPLPISTRTCEVVAPFFTSMTVPLIWLRALMRMMVLTKIAGGAAIPDISVRSGRMKSPSAARYCLASGAASTWRQAVGNCASVIGGFCFWGALRRVGWVIEYLYQHARSAGLQPFPPRGL